MFSPDKLPPNTLENAAKQNCHSPHGMPGTVSEPYNNNLKNKHEHKKLARPTQCPIYVHHFKQNIEGYSNNCIQNDWRTGSQIHQSKYRHESNDFCKSVSQCKKHFESLNLKNKCAHGHSSKNFLDRLGYHLAAHSGAKIDKAFLFKLEHKAIADKLEETYWAKWKPRKSPSQTSSTPKTKTLYTENEKVFIPENGEGKVEKMGDSKETITTDVLPEVDSTHSHINIREENSEPMLEIRKEEEGMTLSAEPNSDADVPMIKHTDSLVLIAKKGSEDKLCYQQPKCIKLFKNPGYTSTAAVNYVKGGSYPLKSCLRKETASFKTTPVFGVKVRRPSLAKGNRFITQ